MSFPNSQVASDFTSALEKLISAYSKIAEILPRFDRLSSAFRGNADFQRVLATVYADILRFHEEAYKVFRKPGIPPIYILIRAWIEILEIIH